MFYIGILFSLGALVGWAIGDFLIQKTVRAMGVFKSLFYIGIIGFVGITPFIYKELALDFLNPKRLIMPLVLGTILVLASLMNFEGLRQGKLSVVLPLTGLELPIVILLSRFIGGEHLGLHNYLLIGLVVLGILFTGIIKLPNFKKIRMEKGVWLAIGGAVGLGAGTFLIGIISRNYSPLFSVWLTHTCALLVGTVFLIKEGTLCNFKNDLKKFGRLIFWQSALDNLAWISYSYATIFIPISIAATVSESYIALGALLGVYLNHEKLRTHQKFGIALAISGALILSYISKT